MIVRRNDRGAGRRLDSKPLISTFVVGTAGFELTTSASRTLPAWIQPHLVPGPGKGEPRWLQFHDLRRANATGLVLEGIDPKTAQTRLGHTDPRLTLATCARATTEADRQAADRLGETFLPRSDRGRGRSLA